MITRAVTHNEQLWYQLYRQPMPVKDLMLEDLQDGEVRLGGSLRGAFSNNERSMCGWPAAVIRGLWEEWLAGEERTAPGLKLNCPNADSWCAIKCSLCEPQFPICLLPFCDCAEHQVAHST